jgi:hypothetical protein
LLGKALLIARNKGIPVAEYLSELVRGPIIKDYDRLLREGQDAK